MTRSKITAALVLGLLCALTSCSSSKSRVGGAFDLSTDLKVDFAVSKSVNPDSQRRPSPVFLRLYELKDPSRFERADFIDLYERDQDLLGDSLIAKRELDRFVPGEVRSEMIVLKPGTKYVGLYGEFYQYDDSVYKVVFQVTENNVVTNKVNIKIVGNTLQLTK